MVGLLRCRINGVSMNVISTVLDKWFDLFCCRESGKRLRLMMSIKQVLFDLVGLSPWRRTLLLLVVRYWSLDQTNEFVVKQMSCKSLRQVDSSQYSFHSNSKKQKIINLLFGCRFPALCHLNRATHLPFKSNLYLPGLLFHLVVSSWWRPYIKWDIAEWTAKVWVVEVWVLKQSSEPYNSLALHSRSNKALG